MIRFIQAARPKTLIVSLAPTITCYFYVNAVGTKALPLLLVCACLSAMLIQIATNLFNDVLDHEKGADKVRLGPERVSAAGLVETPVVRRWAYVCLAGALITAVPLIIEGGPVILILGLVSLYLSYGYTGGIVSLAYRGLGELFVFLFFGLFAFLGSQYIFMQQLTQTGMLLSFQYGLLAVTFIAINNLRDRQPDLAVKKRTLATRMPAQMYRLLIALTILLPYVINFIITQKLNLVWIGMLLALPFVVTIYRREGRELNPCLSMAGAHMFLFTILTIQELSRGNIS